MVNGWFFSLPGPSNPASKASPKSKITLRIQDAGGFQRLFK
jgi:hypothetical protein